MRTRIILWLFILSATSAVASAGTTSYTGSLDPSNANDVLLTTFVLSNASDVTIQSYGYGGSANAPGGTNAAGAIIASGGFDTYFSLFLGGDPSATFLVSNDDGGCAMATPGPNACEDSRLQLSALAAGTYTLALTLPSNYSSAENYGYGTLGDGFTNLQGDYYDYSSGLVRTSAYAFDITTNGAPTAIAPEPGTFGLLLTGLFGAGAKVASRRKLFTR